MAATNPKVKNEGNKESEMPVATRGTKSEMGVISKSQETIEMA